MGKQGQSEDKAQREQEDKVKKKIKQNKNETAEHKQDKAKAKLNETVGTLGHCQGQEGNEVRRRAGLG